MPRTRSKGASLAGKNGTKAGGTTATKTGPSRYILAGPTESPLRVLILPRKVTADARIVTLQNPRYSKPTRYLVCPNSGFFEFTRTAAPQSSPRSWLIDGHDGELPAGSSSLEAHVSKAADFYVATPIDPLFILLPALAKEASSKSSESAKRMFLSSGDHIQSLLEEGHMSEVLAWESVRNILEARMAAVCDTVDIGSDPMYRLNEGQLLSELVFKARRMSARGLPKSMEDKFVAKVLDAPILGLRSTAGADPLPQAQKADPSPSKGKDKSLSQKDTESQSSVASIATSASSLSEASTAATSTAGEEDAGEVMSSMQASEEVVELQRLRVAFDFICSSYIAPLMAAKLKKDFSSSKSSVDFQPLEDYLARLAKVKQEIAASRESNFSRKRERDEEDDERAEKKRKRDEEDKRKKQGQSRGVRELKKVDTKGMKKLSDFFKKK